MRPDFSEFSYGFAFTHEYVNRNPGLKAAPELPSLIKEAEVGHDLASESYCGGLLVWGLRKAGPPMTWR